jgi:ferredoxin
LPAVTYLTAGAGGAGAGPGVRVDCAEGDSVFEVARRAGIAIATACVGKANCGLCRVKIVAGEAHLTPLNPAERKHLGNVYFITKLRLACQARVQGAAADVVVEIP